jgi:sigma-E factor negative regulatory protein RseC
MNSYEHLAKVTKLLPDNKIEVEVNKISACSTCSLKGGCGVSSDSSKNTYIIDNTVNANVGDELIIKIKQKALYKSVFIAYVLPIIIILITATIIDYLFKKEIYTAVFSLVTAGIYFLILKFILKNKQSDITVKIIG